MSNIASYPLITPKGGDLLVGSETYDINLANPVKGNPTRNFSVSSVVSTQIPSYVIGTVNKIPVFTSANKIQDSIMTETAAGGSFTGKYISVTAAGGGLSTQNLEVNKALIDGAGSTGTDGFLLSSTTVGGDKEVAWINSSSFLSAYLPLTGGTLTGNIYLTANKGIYFSGNTTSAYELDNYQEGTFTPLLGGNWASNPTNITGQFTRVGNKVTINIKWQGGSKADITTGYFRVLPTIPLAGELFVGSVSGANFLNFGVATISPGSAATDSAIYLSNNDFDTPAQNYFATITYLMAT